MRKAILCAVILIAALLNTRCKHDPIVGPVPGLDDTTVTSPGDTFSNEPSLDSVCDSTVVYFERDIMPILSSSCAISGCHDATSRQNGVELTSYAKVRNTADVRPGNPEGSDLYEVLVEDKPDKRMPYNMGPLPASQIALIKKWIEQGAKNLKCVEQAGCDTANMSYTGNIKPILEANCVSCHNSSLTSGGVNLSIYTGVRAVAINGHFYGAISHDPQFKPMPQNLSGEKIEQCKIDQIKSWIDAGAKNN